MKVTVTWGPRKARQSYVLQADSLEQALSVLQARDEWGRFEQRVPYKFKAKAQIVTSVALSPTSSILLPRWPMYELQPQSCKDEWDRMLRALKGHEESHATLFESSFRKLVADLEKQTRMTVNDFDSYINRQFEQIQKESDEFDRKTDHGSSRGVELQINAECRSRN